MEKKDHSFLCTMGIAVVSPMMRIPSMAGPHNDMAMKRWGSCVGDVCVFFFFFLGGGLPVRKNKPDNIHRLA